jgi:Fis family transcriptional regulator
VEIGKVNYDGQGRVSVGRNTFRGESVVKTSSKKKITKKKTKKAVTPQSQVCARIKPLSALTDEALKSYFASLNGHRPGDLYQLVIGEVEKPLFKAVLSYTKGNQSRAAEILGINRGTLRKKLKSYELVGD